MVMRLPIEVKEEKRRGLGISRSKPQKTTSRAATGLATGVWWCFFAQGVAATEAECDTEHSV